MRNICEVLIGELQGKRSCGRPRHGFGDNTLTPVDISPFG
jgi:hypothetical protein